VSGDRPLEPIDEVWPAEVRQGQGDRRDRSHALPARFVDRTNDAPGLEPDRLATMITRRRQHNHGRSSARNESVLVIFDGRAHGSAALEAASPTSLDMLRA
jgi:hypothetical protein